MRELALCAGYGGSSLALGTVPEFVSEIDPHANRVLAARFPDAVNLGTDSRHGARRVADDRGGVMGDTRSVTLTVDAWHSLFDLLDVVEDRSDDEQAVIDSIAAQLDAAASLTIEETK